MRLEFADQSLECREGETVLESLERHGFARPSSCRSGHCQVCMMRARSGKVPAKAQEGLKPTQREQGYLLPCVCRPEEPLVLDDGALEAVEAKLRRRDRVAQDIAVLEFEVATPLELRAGQFVHVLRDDGVTRPYSVASPPEDGALELHVRLRPGGAMSPWLVEGLPVGGAIQLRGPFGSCFYTDDAKDRPLLLAGTSTGLAPLLGIIRDALALGHRGPIRLFHGAAHRRGLYLRDELRRLADAHPQLEVTWCALASDAEDPDVRLGSLQDLILATEADWKAQRVFLCGDPTFVNGTKRRLFLAGTALAEIFSDPFA